MKNKELRKQLKKMTKAEGKYKMEQEAMASMIGDYANFETIDTRVGGDGEMIANNYNDNIAPVEDCIEVIEEVGRLSYEDYDDICI